MSKTEEGITIKLHEWFLKWFELYREKGIRNSTVKKYKRCYEELINQKIGQKDIRKITREDAQNYFDEYGKNRSKLTVDDRLKKLKACFRDAQIDGLVESNPFERVSMVYKEQQLSFEENKNLRDQKKWLEVDEYDRMKMFLINSLNQVLQKEPFILEGTKRNAIKYQVSMMIIFVALKTGMRYSEILGLTREDINRESNELRVEKTWDYKKDDSCKFLETKNYASVRMVVVDSETMEVIENYIKWLDSSNMNMKLNTLFNEINVSNYNSSINSFLELILTSLGIERITIHKLRHTQASYLLAKDVSIQVVAKRLGHTDTNMIRKTYGHLLKETEEKANKQIVGLL